MGNSHDEVQRFGVCPTVAQTSGPKGACLTYTLGGQQVVTFAMIDKVHARPDGTAKRNFDKNRARFESGTDFVLVSLTEMRRAFPGAFFPRGGGDVTLLTRRGYLKIAKTLHGFGTWLKIDERLTLYLAYTDQISGEHEAHRRSFMRKKLFAAALVAGTVFLTAIFDELARLVFHWALALFS